MCACMYVYTCIGLYRYLTQDRATALAIGSSRRITEIFAFWQRHDHDEGGQSNSRAVLPLVNHKVN